jgi:hypothetical protein
MAAAGGALMLWVEQRVEQLALALMYAALCTEQRDKSVPSG